MNIAWAVAAFATIGWISAESRATDQATGRSATTRPAQTAPASQPVPSKNAQEHKCYIGGNAVPRPGAYELDPKRRATVGEMLDAAGAKLQGNSAARVRILRRLPGNKEQLREFSLVTVMAAKKDRSQPDLVVQDDDKLMVTNPATRP